MEKIFAGILPRGGLGDLLPAELGRITCEHAGADFHHRRRLDFDLVDRPLVDQRRRARPMAAVLEVEEWIDADIDFAAQPSTGPRIRGWRVVLEDENADIYDLPVIIDMNDAARDGVDRAPLMRMPRPHRSR